MAWCAVHRSGVHHDALSQELHSQDHTTGPTVVRLYGRLLASLSASAATADDRTAVWYERLNAGINSHMFLATFWPLWMYCAQTVPHHRRRQKYILSGGRRSHSVGRVSWCHNCCRRPYSRPHKCGLYCAARHASCVWMASAAPISPHGCGVAPGQWCCSCYVRRPRDTWLVLLFFVQL